MSTKTALLIAFVALQCLDVISTSTALSSCATCHEGNPLIAAAMSQLGAWWWVAKLGIVLCTVPIMARHTRLAAAACTFMAVVVVSNFSS